MSKSRRQREAEKRLAIKRGKKILKNILSPHNTPAAKAERYNKAVQRELRCLNARQMPPAEKCSMLLTKQDTLAAAFIAARGIHN